MLHFLDTELNYLRCFCAAEAVPGGVRLRDAGITDMYAHNLTYVTEPLSDAAFVPLYLNELRVRREEGQPFLNLTFEHPLPPAQESLADLPKEATTFDYFVYGGAPLTPRADCAILPMTRALCAEALALDLQSNGADFGADFIRRRFERRSAVYLTGGVQHLLCYHAGRAVGACDLFVENGYAKLEDFDVMARYQRKGFGTALLADLIARAQRAGAHTIYLVTDDADTAKDMYKKSGFTLAAQKYEVVLPA